MSEVNRLNSIERDHFTEIVETSLRVNQRSQFFSWTHGILQALVPHEIMICGADEGAGDSIKLMYMSGSRYFRHEQFEASCLAPGGVVSRLIAEWQQSGEPRVLARPLAVNGDAEIVDRLESAELRNIALHGVRGPGRRILGFYAFSRLPADSATQRLTYILDVVVPHIHTTFVRVQATEARSAATAPRNVGRQITPREAEILRWIKEGKTNADIAEILTLSPWTVKNHVQAILKKLQAQTRSHAVARAMSMGILDNNGPH